jgi:serine/threonine protein kinase
MIITMNTKIFGIDDEEYVVTDSIGQGGFGSVFKLEDSKGNPYAIKTLPNSYASDELFRGLLNEAENAADIDHPNVLKHLYFHDGNTYESLPPYIIMEYANHGTLKELMEEDKLSYQEKLELVPQLISGIKAVNEVLVHRDLKPANILFHAGVAKIADFGLSKLIEDSTRTMSFKGYGTPLYMSPESWKNHANTISMDIYSMGLILYELLTGKYPFTYDPQDYDSLRNAHLYTNVASPHELNPEIDNNVSQMLIKMVKKNPKERYENWDEVLSAFESEGSKGKKYSSLVKTLVSTKINADSEQERMRLEEEQQQKAKEDYATGVVFQLENEVILSFTEFLDEINEEVPEEYEYEKVGTGKYRFSIFQKGIINIDFQVLHDEVFMREIPSNFGRGRTIRKVVRPTYDGKLVMGWGKVSSNKGHGFNLILYGDPSVEDGSWVMTRSTNSSIARQGSHTKLPEPFAFELSELEKEIQLFTAMHIYNTTGTPFSIDFFAELVKGLFEQ